MNENKTIIGLLLIIAILGAALFIKIVFFRDTNYLSFKTDENGTVVTNISGAEQAVVNKTFDYVQSVQEEKDQHKELENEWSKYSN